MASNKSASECSTGQCPQQFPKFYVSNIPKFLTQIGIKTYFENSVGKVLDVEIQEILPEAALVTLDGLQGFDKMSEPHHIADQKLSVLHLYTEKTTLEITSPAATALSGDIKELADKWNVTLQAQENTVTITGHCDRVYAFRADFNKYVSAKLTPPSHPSVAAHTAAVGSYPQPQHTETADPSGTPDGHSQETPAGGMEGDSLSTLSTGSETRQVFSNLSPDALALLEKNSEEEMLGVRYNTKAGSVQIEGQSKSELEDRISRFQSAYQSILTPRRLKAEPVPVSPALDDAQVTSVVASFNDKYNQCVFVYHEGPPRTIKVVSISSRQFDQAKKLLMEALHPPPTATSTSFSTLEVISIPNGRRLTLKKADIVHENVDVIVNAANERLQHGGGVAGALNRATHGALQRYSDAYVHQKGSISVGDVAVTHGGGALKCKVVIHAVGPTNAYAPPECKRLIARVISESLTKAEKHNFISIAIPAISSGIFGVNKDLVASCVIDSIIGHKFSKAAPVLSDIRIVIIDEATFSCFAWHFNQRKAQRLGQVPPKQPPESQSAGVGKLINIDPEAPSQPPDPAGQSSKLNPPPPLDGAGQSDAVQSLQNVLAPFKKEDANPMPSLDGTEQSATVMDQESHHDSPPPPSHNGTLLTPEDLPTLVNCLKAVPHKWEPVAIQLGFDSTICAKLRVEHFNTADKLEKMLTVWLQRAEPPPTLEMLVNALASQTVKENGLAEALPGLLQQARTRHPSLPSPNGSNPSGNVEGGTITYPQLGTNPQPDKPGAMTNTVLPMNPSPDAEAKPTDSEAAFGSDPLSATSPTSHQPHGNSAGAHITNVAVSTTSKVSYSHVAAGHGTGASTTSAPSTDDKEGSKRKSSAGGGINMPCHVDHGKSNPKTGRAATGSRHGKPVNPNPGAIAKTANCSICLEPFKDPTKTNCGHKFCRKCLQESLHHSPYCPTCRKPLRQIVGNQPPGIMTHKVLYLQSLPGYSGYNTIEITYSIPNGTQGPEHPNPGRPFSGAHRVAYLPDSTEGREVLKLLKKAFDARLIFTVGTSHTSGRKDTVVWNDIHHKTNTSGGQQNYGYPDKTYLQRVKEDLAAKGIVPDGSHTSTSV